MNAFAVKVLSFREFCTKYEKTIINSFSFVAWLLLWWRAFWQADAIVVVSILILLMSGLLMVIRVAGGAGSTPIPLLIVRAVGIYAFAALSMLSIVRTNDTSIVLRLSDGETTLTHSYLIAMPFAGDATLVPISFNQWVTEIPITTGDETPLHLTCSVTTEGMELDFRDPVRLEEVLLARNGGQNPTGFINADLQAALRAAAITELTGKSGKEIADANNRFSIQYSIGTPVGNVLAQDGIRWREGSVDYKCKVVFDS